MAEFPEIGISLIADISDYKKDLNNAIKLAAKAESALGDIKTTVTADTSGLDKLSKAVAGIGDASIKVDVEAENLNTVKSDIAELGQKVTTRIDVDTADVGDAKREIATLGELLEVKFTADISTAKRSVEKLKANDLTISVDADVKTAKSKIEDLKTIGGNIKLKVDALTGGAQKAINTIKAPKVALDVTTSKAQSIVEAWATNLVNIEAAINLTALVPSDLGEIPFVGQIFDLNRDVKRFNSTQLAEMASRVEDIGGILQRAVIGQWADSTQEAEGYARSVLQITGDAENLEAIMTTTFEAMTGTGEDFEKTLRAQDILVRTGMAASFKDAANIITVGFQSGLNLSDDFLDTLIEYSSQFSQMGISAAQFLTLMSQGFEGGVFNADKMADAFKEGNIRIQEATDSTSNASKALDQIGQRDETLAFLDGTLAGEIYWADLVAAINAGIAAGDLSLTDAVEILGTPLEDLTVDVLARVDLTDVPEQFTEAGREGAANIKATEFFSDAQTAIDTLLDTISIELGNTLAEMLDLEGFIDRLTSGIGDFSSLISEGEGIPEAIEIAFELDGFADTVHNLESGLANFLIGLLQFVASIQESILVGDTAGAEVTRAEVARLATGQLEFDLDVATDVEGVIFAVQTAISRGVNATTFIGLLQGKFDEAVAVGDFKLAEKIKEEASKISFGSELFGGEGANIEFGLGEQIFTGGLEENQAAAAELLENLQATMAAAVEAGDFGEAFNIAEMIGLDEEGLGELQTQMEEAFSFLTEAGDFEGAREIAEQMNILFGDTSLIDAFNIAINEYTTSLAGIGPIAAEHLPIATKAVFDFTTGTTIQLQNLTTEANTAKAALEGIGGVQLPDVGGGSGGGSSTIPAGRHGGQLPSGLGMVHKDELIMNTPPGMELSVLNAQTSDTIMSALGQIMGGMGISGGDSTNSETTNNITINTASAAEDIGAMNATSNAIRGF